MQDLIACSSLIIIDWKFWKQKYKKQNNTHQWLNEVINKTRETHEGKSKTMATDEHEQRKRMQKTELRTVQN